MVNSIKVSGKRAAMLRTLATGLVVLVLISVALAGSGSRLQGMRASGAPLEPNASGSALVNMPEPLLAWQLIIEKLMERAEPSSSGLKEGVRYLAIDADTLTGLTSEQKKTFFDFLENYGFEVLDKSRKELEQEGYIVNLTFKEGNLIEVKLWTKSFRVLEVDASLYHSGAGAHGLKGMVIAYRNDRWQIEHAGGYFVA